MMENKELDEDLFDLDDESPEENDQEQDIDINSLSSQELCDIIISFRYLGLFKDKAILCMKKLSENRNNGDDFQFEDYIEKELSNLPKIDLTDIKSFFQK